MNGVAVGQTLTLHYIEGRPDGMLTAEMLNWTGHVLMTPRTQLAAALDRKESAYAGLYLLLGDLEGRPQAYIGESDEIATRIKSHDAKKDWWTRAALITAAGNKLNKAQLRYLEARLISEALRIGRVSLENGTNPLPPALSEAETSNMEVFLRNLLMVLPAVRVDMFVERVRPGPSPIIVATPFPPAKSGAVSPDFILEHKKLKIRAVARVEQGEFLVQAGSTACRVLRNRASAELPFGKLHAELLRSGVLAPKDDLHHFTKTYAFSSPSAAGSVIKGYSTNGQTGWITDDGQTYKAWEASQLAGR